MPQYRWTRTTTRNLEEEWHLRLCDIDPSRIVMLQHPDSRVLRIQVFGDEKTVSLLARRFGGKTSRLAPSHWTGAESRAPIPIRGMLRIHGTREGFEADPDPRRAILLPAGMAFGTGDHATTATCLRLLCDILPDLPAGWTALDAGTGSGLLAIAAERLGAASVQAFDSDPVCVRVARENAQANGCRHVEISKADTRRLGAFRSPDVILANLYSELLVSAAPGFARKLRPGGRLVYSGVLRGQAQEVAEALVSAGFAPPRITMRGKWCAGSTLKP